MKTPEELCKEWAKENIDIATQAYCYGVVNQSFLAGFNAGHSNGFDSAMKIHDAVAEHIMETECFNHGHPVQVKAAQHAKNKSDDAGVRLWTENSFIVGYNEGYKDAQEHAHAELEEAKAKIASLRERVADLTWELEEEAL